MESGYTQPWFYGMSQAFSISRNHPYTTAANLLVARHQLTVVKCIPCDRLASGTQVLGPPGALQGFGDLLLVVLTPPVAEGGEPARVPFAGQDGFDHGHARHPGDVAD